jgi:hypothetical protein
MATKEKPTGETPGDKPVRKRRPRRTASGGAVPPRSDDANAFIPDPEQGPARTSDDLAELLAEDFVESATRGNEVLEDDLDQPLSDEIGGPFVVTRAREEFAEGTDDSNPEDAEAAPLPKPVAGLVQRPRAEALEESEADEDEERAENEDDDDDVEGVRAEDLGEDEEAEDDEDEEKDEDDEEETLMADALEEPSDDEEDLDDLDDGTRRRTR